MQDAALSTGLPPAGRRHGAAPALAALTVASIALVVAASAWLRLSQSLPCDGWPACRTGSMAWVIVVQAQADALQHAARLVHRASATAVLVAAFVLVALTRGSGSAQRLARGLVGIALALAVLGVVTRLPAMVGAAPSIRLALLAGNLMGGLCALALGWSLWLALRPVRALSAAATRLARGTLGLWTLQALAGALSGADASPAAPLLHLLLALAALPCALWLGWTQCRGARAAEARALLVLVLLQPLLGVLALAGAAAPVLVWLHNTSAAAGLALLAGLVLAAPVNEEG